MLPSTSCVSPQTQFNSNENILDQTQRLIEEAELKLRFMETGLSHDTNSTRPTVYSYVDEHRLSSSESKNQRLKLALDNKMRKLEKQLETHWKKQVIANDLTDAAVDPNATLSICQTQSSKRGLRSRVRRPCRKLSEADHGTQDVVDVVRTARDSVHGALLAAQKLSASLGNRTPRQSRRSTSVTSIRPTSDIQAAESDRTHFCPEHGTKRKVCSCLRPDYEGSKLEDKEVANRDEGPTPCEVVSLATRKSNVGIFQAKCTAGVRESNRPLLKRLEVSVMPSLTIKRGLEKHVMPVIEVPFPGSYPEPDKRENTGVRNFRHADPTERAPKGNLFALTQQACSKVSLKDKFGVPDSPDGCAGDMAVNSAVEPVHNARDLLGLDQSQLTQILKYLLEKMTAPQTSTLTTTQRPPSHQQTTSTSKVDRPDESHSEKSSIISSILSSGSSQPVPKDEGSATEGHGGSVAYNSLSRFLQTYSKAAAESKRARQKAAERRREEERSMKAQEQRFKSDGENRSNEGYHALIGPFRRAILKGNLRKNSTLLAAPSINERGTDVSPSVISKEDSSDRNAMEFNLENEINDKTRCNQPEVTSESSTPFKHTQPLEERSLVSESEEGSKNLSRNSARSKSNADEHPDAMVGPIGPVQSLTKRESSNDEYEDDWEEENEGDSREDRVETRDVGDGSERDIHDEITDGLAHTLRTIVEVEENSSPSVSLVHHEHVSQPTESGPIKSGSQPPSKSSLAEADLALPQTEKVQPLNSLMDATPWTAVGEEQPKASKEADVKPAAQSQKDEFSGNRAFLEMTESLKKMLEAVVSSLVQNKPESAVPTSSKMLGVRFESGKSRIRRYDLTSSGSPNDELVSSGSEASYSRSVRWNTQANRRSGGRVRFKTGTKRSSATQTDGDEDELKRDAGTQVTPVKDTEERQSRKGQGWQLPSHLYLRPSTLSLERTTLRPSSRPISLSFDMDPTERLLAFGKSAPCQMKGVPAFSGGGTSILKVSPEQERRGSLSLCDSLSSSSCSALPLDGLAFSANNTNMSLSEGEVLAYHSCSCSEGEICLCAGTCRKNGDNYSDGKSADRMLDEPVVTERASPTKTHWSILDSTATDDLLDLSDHFSEGEVIEKLIEISHLLNGQSNERRDPSNASKF